MDVVRKLLLPQSVAIVGASADTAKLTGRPLVYLEKYGFSGNIYPVNPRYETIGNRRCYPNVAALPYAPEVAIVLLGASRVVEEVKQLAAIGVGAAIVLASGFGESGLAGQQRQEELKRAAGAMRLLGPNTIGLVNVTDRIVLSASNALVTDDILPGSIALVSQSGGILGSLLSRAQALGLGLSKLIATGNECDLEVSDFVDYLVDDPATKIITLYLEGLRKPKQFHRAVARARAAGKPVAAFKVGRSDSGIRSAVSHTGALAGSDAAYDALFRQCGVIRAERYADLLDIPLGLSCGRTLKGKRIAIITSSGGAASLLADAAGMNGFETPAPDEATAARLVALDIEGATLDRNPIDVTLAGVKPDALRTVIDSVVASPNFDAVAVVLGSSALREPETVGKPLRECAAASDKPIMGFVSPSAPLLVRALNIAGVPTFAEPEGCAVALSALRAVGEGNPYDAPSPAVTASVGEDVRALLRPGPLNEAESKRLFASFGIPVTREAVAATPAEAERAARNLGGNVVVKALSRHVPHKSEAGGVALDVPAGEVARTCTRMADSFAALTLRKPEGFLVQELVSGGVEMILGFNQDAQLGPMILLGMGGVTAELFRDTALRLVPVSRREAARMIDELKSAALLEGFRGRPSADTGALVDAVVAFSDMIAAIGDRLQEAEINPLFVLPRGEGVLAADGVVVVSETVTADKGRPKPPPSC